MSKHFGSDGSLVSTATVIGAANLECPEEAPMRWECHLDLPLQQTREPIRNMQHIHDYRRVDRDGACTDD